MNDKELADAVVALGVGSCNGYPYYQNGDNHHDLTEDQFVSDWVVAGSLLEKVRVSGPPPAYGAYKWLNVMRDIRSTPLNDLLPRAVVSSCVDSLLKENAK